MEPIPETADAIRQLEHDGSDGHLLADLMELSVRVQEVVPDCIGMSWACLDSGLAFTLVVTESEMAVLDAVQYLAGGPCVDSVAAGGEVIETTREDLFDEPTWQLLARATASAGVASTLTLPIYEEGMLTGSINLYGASANAFTGHHEQLAEILGGWADGAVTNADLSFDTRRAARHSPQKLEQEALIAAAARLLAARLGIETDEARQRMADAARRADISEATLAAAILDDDDA